MKTAANRAAEAVLPVQGFAVQGSLPKVKAKGRHRNEQAGQIH
jgi:hypothetical protein